MPSLRMATIKSLEQRYKDAIWNAQNAITREEESARVLKIARGYTTSHNNAAKDTMKKLQRRVRDKANRTRKEALKKKAAGDKQPLALTNGSSGSMPTEMNDGASASSSRRLVGKRAP